MDVYIIPFSHLDLFWAGTREECLSRGNRIIAKAIALAEKYPRFRVLLEDEVFVANYVESHRGSAELDQLKRLVKEGRIEIGPKWAGIYQNLPRGEALVRNLVYGKRYAREVFGVDPQVIHLGDLPGYTWQFPQILAKSGIPRMVMTRMGPPDRALFRWRAPDTSTALVWYAAKGYGWGVGLGLHREDLDDNRLAAAKRSIEQVQAVSSGPIYLSWGTDLFTPSEQLIRNVGLLNERLAPMRFRLATPTEYFAEAAKAADVPESAGDIPSSWANIISSNCHLWPPTIAATDTLLTAEKFAAVNYALGYADYPQAELESLWKGALEAMDHNNYGQGGQSGDDGKLELAQRARLRGGQIVRDMLRNIAERVKSPIARSAPIVVFNPLSWMRDDVVRTHVSLYGDVSPGDINDYRKAMRLVDETGTPTPFYIEQSSGTVSRALEIIFVAQRVPSLGYKTYFIVPADKPDVFTNACQVKLDSADEKQPRRIIGADQLENEFYRVSIDRATGCVGVFDKEMNRAVVKDMEIVASEERGGNSLNLQPRTGRTLELVINRVGLEENNPVRAVVRIEGELAGVSIAQRVLLYRGIRRIDLENTIEWKQNRFMTIEQLFPYTDPKAQVRYGIPFGSAGESDVLPNCGPHAGDEVSREEWKRWRQIQDWIFAGTAEYGITVAADRQLMVLGEGLIRAGMLRGTYSSTGVTRGGKQVLVQVPPPGRYVFRYSLSSGKGGWAASRSHRLGRALHTPLIPIVAADELSTKSLPPTNSFCSLDADNLAVTALKKSDRENALVLRVCEMNGSPAQTSVLLLGAKRAFRPLNLLEELTHDQEEQMLRVKPCEISTVRFNVR